MLNIARNMAIIFTKGGKCLSVKGISKMMKRKREEKNETN